MNGQSAQIEQAFADAGLIAFAQDIYLQFEVYLALLTRWNARLNLTAVRDPQQIIRRHFVECAFAAQHLPVGGYSLLDYGSGSGFPGIPFAICKTELTVTLAESNGKKAAFLREAGRSIPVRIDVYAGRVENLPSASMFDAVSLRAVERMEEAIPAALKVARKWLVLFTTQSQLALNRDAARRAGACLQWQAPILLPGSEQRLLCLAKLG